MRTGGTDFYTLTIRSNLTSAEVIQEADYEYRPATRTPGVAGATPAAVPTVACTR